MDVTTPDGRGAHRAPRAGRTSGSGLFVLLWLVFLLVLAVEPERLDAVWTWFRDLPVIAQVAGWVLLLPLVVGLAVWQAPWALWIRVTVIVLLALANIAVFSPRSRDA